MLSSGSAQSRYARPRLHIYFAAWYAFGLIVFWVFGYEPKGRTFDEIDEALATPAAPGTVRAPMAGTDWVRQPFGAAPGTPGVNTTSNGRLGRP